MNYCRHVILILIAALAVTITPSGWSVEKKDNHVYQPISKIGVKWRIAYYQGGGSYNYYPYLIATIKGLMDLGWIDKQDLPVNKDKDPKELWNWLAKSMRSNYIEFIADGFYSANWDGSVRTAISKSIINRLKTKKDVDLIIAMGTWAGKDLANDEHNTPVVVISSTDPIGAGIIKSNEDSGYDHVFARVDPRRYERQVIIFHDVIRFKKLGIAYENSSLGKTYAAIDLIEAVAKERQFEIIRCFTKDDIPDQEQAGVSVIKCFDELAPQVDALYFVIQNGINDKTLPKLVSIANKYHVPTFSQQGSEEVSKGVLMSISREGGFGPVGRFLAISIAKIFNGAKPRQLNQVFEEGPTIAINLKTAELIGLYLSAEVLAASDEMYREIVNP